MDGSSKIAAAIVLSAFLVIVATLGYKEYDRQRTINEAREAVSSFVGDMQTVEAKSAARSEAQRVAQLEYEMARRSHDIDRRTLAANQRCVGGSVVQVDGSTYTQIGTISYPIHCAGRLADRPLR